MYHKLPNTLYQTHLNNIAYWAKPMCCYSTVVAEKYVLARAVNWATFFSFNFSHRCSDVCKLKYYSAHTILPIQSCVNIRHCSSNRLYNRNGSKTTDLESHLWRFVQTYFSNDWIGLHLKRNQKNMASSVLGKYRSFQFLTNKSVFAPGTSNPIFIQTTFFLILRLSFRFRLRNPKRKFEWEFTFRLKCKHQSSVGEEAESARRHTTFSQCMPSNIYCNISGKSRTRCVLRKLKVQANGTNKVVIMIRKQKIVGLSHSSAKRNSGSLHAKT